MKDLKKVSRPSRTKPGMQDFFILILSYSYYNKSTITNEFSIPQTVLADYFNCTPLTIKRWFSKLRELGFIKYAERYNAGKVVYYKDKNNIKQQYTIPKYKKIRCGKPNEIKFLNIYILDQKQLNQYLIDCVDINVLDNIEQYKDIFNNFIKFLSNRSKRKDIIDNLDLDNINLDNIDETTNKNLSKDDKRAIKKAIKLHNKIKENEYYLDIKHNLDKQFPEFTCKYLEEGCLRLTHEICSTVNPEHTEKINENNYWRSSHVRTDMLQSMLNTNLSNITEYDVNGSIYRLTYNLTHDELLSVNLDIYELIWNNCNFNIKWTNKNKDKYRNAFKSILMPLYMKPYLIGYKSSQWEYIHKYYAGHPRKYKRLSKLEQQFYETYNIFVESLKIPIKEFLDRVLMSMYKTLNIQKFSGSNIFTIESNLHLIIRQKLLDKNIKCVNVYDGFYVLSNQLSKDEFIQVYNESFILLKDNMKNDIGTKL